jgi:hypothetical protein
MTMATAVPTTGRYPGCMDSKEAELIALRKQLRETTNCLADVVKRASSGEPWEWDHERVIQDSESLLPETYLTTSMPRDTDEYIEGGQNLTTKRATLFVPPRFCHTVTASLSDRQTVVIELPQKADVIAACGMWMAHLEGVIEEILDSVRDEMTTVRDAAA